MHLAPILSVVSKPHQFLHFRKLEYLFGLPPKAMKMMMVVLVVVRFCFIFIILNLPKFLMNDSQDFDRICMAKLL